MKAPPLAKEENKMQEEEEEKCQQKLSRTWAIAELNTHYVVVLVMCFAPNKTFQYAEESFLKFYPSSPPPPRDSLAALLSARSSIGIYPPSRRMECCGCYQQGRSCRRTIKEFWLIIMEQEQWNRSKQKQNFRVLFCGDWRVWPRNSRSSKSTSNSPPMGGGGGEKGEG